jgi:spermidine synthase
MVCHGELARRRPHPRYLTSYYLMISLGGAIGGLFVALIAPAVFSSYYELPIALAVCAFLVLGILHGDTDALGENWRPTWIAGTALAGALLGYLGVIVHQSHQGFRAMERNFYGGLKVHDEGDGESKHRRLTHGTINHGAQYLAPDRRRWPTTYYGKGSGVGMAINAAQAAGPVRIGVIGLGTGTLAAYGRPGDVIRFYEINPLVVKIARHEFTYLGDCPGKVDVVLGDARLSLERELPQHYDVLAVDAFSSDSIPVHLLTREAFDLYFRHLAPHGVLAVHVSNRFLSLEPVVKRMAETTHRHVRNIDTEDIDETGEFGSTWLLVAAKPEVFKKPALAAAAALTDVPVVRLWTDDYSNLFQILK